MAPRRLDQDPLKKVVAVLPKTPLVRGVRGLVVRRAKAAVGDHLPDVVEPLYRCEEGGQRHRRDGTDPWDGPNQLRLA